MRSRIHIVIGSLICGALFSIAAPPAGAQTPQADLKKESSSTVAAERRSLAARYRAHAAEHEADAVLHDALVAELKARTADDEAWDLARDAAHYAQHSREAAAALRDLAQLHEAAADRLGSVEAGKAPAAGGCCDKHMPDKKAPKSVGSDHTAH